MLRNLSVCIWSSLDVAAVLGSATRQEDSLRGSGSFLRALLVLVQVSLVQAENFAWFGYPDDPEPSARNFLPGLAKAGILTLIRESWP